MDEFKSLTSVVKKKVDEIGYEVFQPPIEKQSIKERLEAIFCVDTPYWLASMVPPGWRQSWFAFQPRVFRNTDHIDIGITVLARSLRIVVYDGIWDNDFEEEFYRRDLPIENIWLDHRKIYEELVQIIEKTIRFVGQNRPDEYNWED